MSEPLQLLPWHAPLWRQVSQSIEQDRLAHALLLSGVPGIGKRSFARLLAAALWCETPLAERLPCGHCSSCRQVVSEAHPGYSVLRVEVDKETKAKKRDIAIDAVRALCERLALTSHDGRAKLAVIDPADMLNRNGVNALLKTIEEPPPRTYMVLISEQPLALLPTLRSRCQQLRFAIPGRAQARAWLDQTCEVPAAVAEAALDAANGAPMHAKRLIEDQSLELIRGWHTILLDIAAGRGNPVDAAAEIIKSFKERREGEKKKIVDAEASKLGVEREEEQVGAFLHWLYSWLLQLLRANLTPGGASPADAQALSGSLPRHALDRYVGEVQENQRRLDSNAKGQLVLESVLIRWAALVALGRRT